MEKFFSWVMTVSKILKLSQVFGLPWKFIHFYCFKVLLKKMVKKFPAFWKKKSKSKIHRNKSVCFIYQVQIAEKLVHK